MPKNISVCAKIAAIFMAISVLFQNMLSFPLCKKEKTEIRQKNVILLIGDGMGFNSIEKTRFEDSVESFNMDNFTLRGQSRTSAANALVTDSAAGGTALSCGIKVNYGSVAVYPLDINAAKAYPMSLTELAIADGKLAGVITTDNTDGATPAAFTSHTSSRYNTADITKQQMDGNMTLIWGAKSDAFDKAYAESNGFQCIKNKSEMDSLTEGSRSFGQFSDMLWHTEGQNGMPTLANMTNKAIDLLDDDEDGFFLMIEVANIDKYSHENNGDKMKEALKSFDDAVGVALDYAEKMGNTLVVVTADHETGGIIQVDGEYLYTDTNHTSANVPLLVYGCDDFLRKGQKIENSEVSQIIACVMGHTSFPIKVKVEG